MSNLPRYLFAFLVPLVAALAVTPVAGRIARRAGIMDHPQPHKFHLQATPYLGGLAVGVALVAVAALTSGRSAQVITVLLGAVALLGVGLVDDWRGMGPAPKLTVEAGLGIALWIANVRAGSFGVPALDLALTILWVVVVVNAVNLLDNMDGIASGVVVISALGAFAIAAYEGDYLVASLALAVAGATLGFLRYNFPPARIFLGDAGALMLGFLLAALGLKLDLVGRSGLARSVIPALLLAVPLFDMVLVVAARLRDGRPIHRGGTDHSAHRLVGRGLSPRGVAVVAYAVQTVCVGLAFWLNVASTDTVIVVALVVGALALGAFAYLIRLDGHENDVRLPVGPAGLGPAPR
jgi:UDP-GlcNAc:undecaprenyl-phosphate GlcNAc-1-phosphate transferase